MYVLFIFTYKYLLKLLELCKNQSVHLDTRSHKRERPFVDWSIYLYATNSVIRGCQQLRG